MENIQKQKALACVFLMIIVLMIDKLYNVKQNTNTGQTILDFPIQILKQVKEYDKELANLYPQEIGNTIKYRGSFEYEQERTLDTIEIQGENETLNIKFIGKTIKDVSSIDKSQPIDFGIEYIIDDIKIVEKILYNDTHLLHSIISNKIIIKKPLETNNFWEEKFIYKDGKEYVAKSTITEINTIDDKKEYTIETVVENIDTYKDNKYVEIRKVKEGKGIVYFKHILEGYNNKTTGKVEYLPFDFEYEMK